MAVQKFDKVGRGIAFPVTLQNGGNPLISEGTDLIESSISDILSSDTPVFFLADYKSRLRQLMFEQNDEVLVSLLRSFILDALNKWEGRIKVTDIVIEIEDGGAVLCNIAYTIIGESRVNTFVYPFYRKIIY
jgi:phage baseplate assembly protein W